MNICLFQGTFNPIHNAHIDVAKFVLNNTDTEQIIFIPALNPPHKKLFGNVSSDDRMNMVKLAVQDYDNFRVSDIEFKRGGKSYTWLTIEELRLKYNVNNKLRFIIGTDAFVKIESWYEAEKLKQYVDFLLFKRDEEIPYDKLDYLKNAGFTFNLMALDFQDISSTDIRDRILHRKSISDLVPKKVEDYINKNDLYRN
ncbi:MAG: nicotinate (nicotinamide) nucleotide adenylyltransferase [Candidatus Gastranaerophilaceae bacterium]|nr:nicotinate (nicotinamide) nucleotide adenylyltransferase [Candidatus Gastranaerophilaceae bacterium]